MLKRSLIALAVVAISFNAVAAPTNAQLSKKIKNLKARMTALESEVDSLNSDVATLNSVVESLDTSNQEQDDRIQGVEEALGYLQPSAKINLVVVDANDNIIGVPASSGVWRSFDGFSGVYGLTFNSITQQYYPEADVFYSDSSCGLDGGEPYISPNDPGSLRLKIGGRRDEGFYISVEGADTELVTWNSRWTGRFGTCDVDGRNLQRNLLPVTPVDFEFDVAYPLKLELR